MDKFIMSNWFLKIISLVLALLLFISVRIDNQVNHFDSANLSLTEVTERVEDVPIQALYDYNNIVVSGLPEKVDILLKGSNSIVKSTMLAKDYQVYVDVSNLPLGKHTVSLQHRNISDKLTVKIEPATVNIVISERTTKKFPIEVEFINKDKLAEGYELEEPLVKPKEISIIGSKEVLDQIVSVKAIVDLNGMDQTFTRNVNIRAYGGNGEELDLTLEPSSVSVTVPIVSPSKVVPIKYQTSGSLPDNVELVDIEVIPNEMTLFGPLNTLKKVEVIQLSEINLSNVNDTTEFKVSPIVPMGLEKILPETVTVKVVVRKMERKKITNIPIELRNVPEGYEVDWITPSSGQLSATVYGEEKVMNGVTASDIKVFVEISASGEGEVELPLQVSGPEAVEIDTEPNKIKIKLVKIEETQ